MHLTLRSKGLLVDPNNAVFHFPFYVNPWMKLSEILGEELPCQWLCYKWGHTYVLVGSNVIKFCTLDLGNETLIPNIYSSKHKRVLMAKYPKVFMLQIIKI